MKQDVPVDPLRAGRLEEPSSGPRTSPDGGARAVSTEAEQGFVMPSAVPVSPLHASPLAQRDDPGSGAFDEPLPFTGAGSVNPLVRAAYPLLELAAVLRQSRIPLPLEELRARLVVMVDAFVERCADVNVETLAAARYGLCTFLDEVIAATQWGGGGAWSSRSLLVTFHGEAAGGERFFTILHRLSQDSTGNLDALELFYLILALGMEGRYRLVEGGDAELVRLRERLRQLIRSTRGGDERTLSPNWKGRGDRRPPPWYVRPLWWVTAGLASVPLLLFAALDYRLRMQALPVMSALQQVHVSQRSVSPEPAPRYAPKLATLLAPEIARRLLRIDEMADRAVITLNSDGLFASGSARVLPAQVSVIRRIGEVLRDIPGRVIVVGHTDNQPPSSGRPSNWQLSLDRAGSVVQLLRDEAGGLERFLAQGRGESEPVAPNDSAGDRARNRRVVITVLVPGASI
ncbi:type IV secretion protein DotU [Burkholderia ubonensis]|uniref:type IVB secretion system protein IcmH/DotU n=1 Tax=Burkholderia ubonensis TaxID=101571 RepID=UPI0007584459|nr:type IVB secretion system protein IcmH/DotU [Burkholderia ubonensis]KVR05434.1 type IV secretion protein DotU [Burkholderia ubonensis]